ncbi:MAG: alpha/beta hydrolase [Erysipelotrichia bacterium]|nr:alpha/beta hydrolase [Erysipelotrichia bacterium]
MHPLLIIIIILLPIIVLFFIIIFILYVLIFYSPLPRQMNDERFRHLAVNRGYEARFIKMVTALTKIPYEDVYITAFDDLELYAKVYKKPHCQQEAILCHGYRAMGYRDFAGITKDLLAKNISVVMIDHRAHGKSEGRSLTLGVREVKDVLKWIEYVKKTFGKKQLILMGFSMGAATVLNCADKVEDDTLIFADSPYSHPKELLQTIIKNIFLPVAIFYPLINLAAIIFARTSMNKLNAYEAIKKSKCRILINHGTKDSVVPQKLSQKLAKAYPDKIRYEVFTDADHGLSYLRDFKRYQKLVLDFIKR